MKNIRFNINLYILVPSIFSGLSILSLLVTYRLTIFYLARDIAPQWPLAFWGAVLVFFTFVCGLLVVRFVIAPVRQFMTKTETMGVLKENKTEDRVDIPKDELHEFSRVFEQVTEILGKVEARELFPEIVGQSAVMRGVFNQILKVATADATVLILGETGTGKELIARSIHRHSRRREKSFVAFNCAAIPEGLLESELFGHEKGAFTGASARKLGQFELADEGTLFLDEIGDMPLSTQAKVLRAIEERTVQRVGATNPRRIDVRFIAATHQNVQDLVNEGKFRQDLYFRLNVVSIHLPPLRRRREDIALLADRFLENIAPHKQLSDQTLQRLMVYDWPGNVRELQNVIESAAVMAGSAERIGLAHLPPTITTIWNAAPSDQRVLLNGKDRLLSLDIQLQEFEKKMLTQALAQSHGVQKKAATLLGLKERSLWHRLKKYNIEASSYKS